MRPDSPRSLRRRDLVHQKFTTGTLIEKRAYDRVIEVRDGELGEGAHPSRTICVRSSRVSRGNRPRLAQMILSANTSPVRTE